MEFSEKALQILQAGGWTEDRFLHPDTFIEKLTNAGYKPLAAALEFLQRFGELKYHFLQILKATRK